MKKLLLIGILAGVACSGPTDSTPEPVWVEKVLLDEDFTGIGFFNLPEGWTKDEVNPPNDKIRILTEGDNYYVEMSAWERCVLRTPNFGEVVRGDKIRIECRYIYPNVPYTNSEVSIYMPMNSGVFLEHTKTWTAFSTTFLVPSSVGPNEFRLKHCEFSLDNNLLPREIGPIVCVDDVIVTRIYQK